MAQKVAKMPLLTTWSGSLHLSYRLLPTSGHLLAFLGVADGAIWEEVFARLPFDAARSKSTEPDPRRYRDARQLYETAGFVYQEDDSVYFTELGTALKRFQPSLNEANRVILAKHAAFALGACQLRNPTEWGSKYDPVMEVFPNQFVWRVMLALDLRVSGEELDRAIFRVRNQDDLRDAIDRIRTYRTTRDKDDLGQETITGANKTAGLSAVMSVASFGWTLIMDTNESEVQGYYRIRPGYERLLEAASAISWPHMDFPDEETYMERISNAAFLPRDLR